jgi:hypothetical protein
VIVTVVVIEASQRCCISICISISMSISSGIDIGVDDSLSISVSIIFCNFHSHHCTLLLTQLAGSSRARASGVEVAVVVTAIAIAIATAAATARRYCATGLLLLGSCVSFRRTERGRRYKT